MMAVDKKNTQFRDDIFGDSGYRRGIHFSESELGELREIIHGKWLANLVRVNPAEAVQFERTALHDYHKISHLIDHQSAWIKDARLFNKNEVSRILSMPFFALLAEQVGQFEVADIEGLGYPEIYWRLVRPGQQNDVAGAHADAWFYDYTNNLTDEQQQGLVKVWAAIHVQPGESGLSVLPGSHLVEWPNTWELRHGRRKPVLAVPQETLDLVTLDTKAGEAVVFNTKLLHAGIPHNGEQTRVSIEFAIRLLT
ncbi:Phytanoyl-CoA dioxygenase (PhyH) [Herbaspirillum sp. CF444]|uniref:phytanoyl-CoA dioxygenase family protein n=1 Tax=Herbaspirillum sp. CF444 TaxID=1144319 RepID=UPI000272343D|nr:phytanoyl-CoA dioxygenase family protein [Herbaspirillum sp. CF444]EJL81431.1 Phytanoyl-CoA dioxygenase (PhyH) [Herbaspirillum sp. CF444]